MESPVVSISGMLAKLINLHICSVIHAAGHGVLLSSSTARWEILEKPCKDVLNALNTVFLPVLYIALDAAMAFIIAFKSQN